MKKALILTVLGLFLLASPAAAQVHSGFSTDSSGCASCHITHAAKAKKLLLSGDNQTEFCMACHGPFMPYSPFDVWNGVTLDASKFNYSAGPVATWDDAAKTYPSYTGGFENTYNFDVKGDGTISDLADIPAKTDSVVYGTDSFFNPSASSHKVEGFGDFTTLHVPGSVKTLSGNLFTCSSCHDPHGYNSTIAGSTGALVENPRLLRHDLNNNNRNHADVSLTLDNTKNRTSGYPDASIDEWCGGCHELFDVGKNSGSNMGTDTRYRHAMGITVNTAGGVNTSMADGTPLSATNKIICLSCHRAHGSASYMTGLANTWTGQDWENTANNVSKSGSVLLRLANRNVCYNCHKEASKNTNATPGAARAANDYN